LYTVKTVYVCVLMTSSISYCLCNTLMDPWIERWARERQCASAGNQLVQISLWHKN